MRYAELIGLMDVPNSSPKENTTALIMLEVGYINKGECEEIQEVGF